MSKKAGNFRKIIFSCTAVFLILCMSGCSVTDLGGTKKQELDFTVLEKEDIPEELKTQIEEKKDEPMKLTYTDQGQMYLVRGYGKKESSGYSIEDRKRRPYPHGAERTGRKGTGHRKTHMALSCRETGLSGQTCCL